MSPLKQWKHSKKVMWVMRRNRKLLQHMRRVKLLLCRTKRRTILRRLMTMKQPSKHKELNKVTLRPSRKDWLTKLTKMRRLSPLMRTTSRISNPNRPLSSSMTKPRSRRTTMLSRRVSSLWMEHLFQMPKKLERISSKLTATKPRFCLKNPQMIRNWRMSKP